MHPRARRAHGKGRRIERRARWGTRRPVPRRPTVRRFGIAFARGTIGASTGLGRSFSCCPRWDLATEPEALIELSARNHDSPSQPSRRDFPATHQLVRKVPTDAQQSRRLRHRQHAPFLVHWFLTPSARRCERNRHAVAGGRAARLASLPRHWHGPRAPRAPSRPSSSPVRPAKARGPSAVEGSRPVPSVSRRRAEAGRDTAPVSEYA